MFGNSSSQNDSCLLKDVGVAQFNKQHLRLGSYVVEFSQLVETLQTREPTAQDWRHIDSLWARITGFVSQHFREEEEAMMAHNYPNYKRQKQQHDSFVKKMMDIQAQIRNRKDNFVNKLDVMLWDWLRNHINKEDSQYRDFFREKGLS